MATILGLVALSGCSGAQEWPERTIRVALEAPNPCWRITLTGIHRDGDAVLAVSRLQPPAKGQMCAQVITTISHQVALPLPAGPVTHLVVGRDSGWGRPPPGYEFLADNRALQARLAGAELIREIGPDEGRRDAGGRVE